MLNILGVLTIIFLCLFFVQCQKNDTIVDQVSWLEKEKQFIEKMNYNSKEGANLIGFRTVYIDDEALLEFNKFYQDNIDELEDLSYDPNLGELRIYFPVNSAIVKLKKNKFEASENGNISIDSKEDFKSIEVMARRKTDKVTGVPENIIKNDTIFLAKSIKADHFINENTIVFDFGERKIMNHNHDHEGHDHGMKTNGSGGCMGNHGGKNCSDTFGYNFNLGKCPPNPLRCRDYNGPVSNCDNYATGAQKVKNFIDSDCFFAVLFGRCWNEHF